MALSLVTGTGQSQNATTVTPLSRAATGWTWESIQPGESRMKYVAGDLVQPNYIRFGSTEIPDIFKNTPYTPLEGQRRDGRSVLIGVQELWKVYDSADAQVVPYFLPITAHMVLKFGLDALVTPTVLVALIQRLVGAAWNVNTDTAVTAFTPILQGITKVV